MKEGWQRDYAHWLKRDLSTRHYVYLWADGVYLQTRSSHDKQCMLVIIGATAEGKKELVGFQTGFRESAQSWSELLLDIKARGLIVSPELAIGDGGMGFWKAMNEQFPTTKHQRCWVHKTVNIINYLPKSLQMKAKADIHNIWMAETCQEAKTAFDHFIKKYQAKYDKAVRCLIKDRAELLTFYDFPAEHWVHIRTTNPIESSFATVRHRTKRSKNCLSVKTAELMVFTLIKAAEKKWLRLRGKNQFAKIIEGATFTNGNEKNNINQNVA